MILYSSTTCPKCKVIKSKLNEKNIEYTVCENEEEAKRLGLKEYPVLEYNGVFYYFSQIITLIREKF